MPRTDDPPLALFLLGLFMLGAGIVSLPIAYVAAGGRVGLGGLALTICGPGVNVLVLAGALAAWRWLRRTMRP